MRTFPSAPLPRPRKEIAGAGGEGTLCALAKEARLEQQRAAEHAFHFCQITHFLYCRASLGRNFRRRIHENTFGSRLL